MVQLLIKVQILKMRPRIIEKQRCVTREKGLLDHTEQNADAKLSCLRGPYLLMQTCPNISK